MSIYKTIYASTDSRHQGIEPGSYESAMAIAKVGIKLHGANWKPQSHAVPPPPAKGQRPNCVDCGKKLKERNSTRCPSCDYRQRSERAVLQHQRERWQAEEDEAVAS